MGVSTTEIKSAGQYDRELKEHSSVAVFFWASWSQPCKQLQLVFEQLAKDTSSAQFLTVEAEEISDVTDRYSVQAVPHFVLLKDGEVVETVEGADAASLTQAVQRHFGSQPSAQNGRPASAAAPPLKQPAAAAAGPQSEEALKALVNQQPVMLFMKGTPDAPRCGFSKRVVGILRALGEDFGSFDVLSDERVRQGIKRFSDWPTFPQLFVRGELLGGCDIITDMQESGELKEAIDDMRDRT